MNTPAPGASPTALLRVLIAPGIVALTAVHWYVAAREETYTGVLRPLDHVFTIALVLGVLWVCGAAGHFLLERWGPSLRSAVERLSCAMALGMAAASVLILMAGSVPGVLGGPVFLLAFTVGGITLRRNMKRVSADARDAVLELRRGAGLWPFMAFWAIGLVLVLLALTPPTDYDSLTYHLDVPQEFLDRGQVHLPQDNLHVTYVGLVHMLYLPLLAARSPSGPAVLGAVAALFLALIVFEFCRRFLDARTARLSLPLLWASPMFPLVAFTPRVDLTLMWFLFLGHHLIVSFAADRSDHRLLWLAAVLLGCAIGVKFNGLLYTVALLPLVAWAIWRSRGTVVGWAAGTVVFGGLFLAATAPWLAKNWILLGAPWYPAFSSRQLPPWIAAIYGSVEIPAQVTGAVFEASRENREPLNFLDFLVRPARITTEAEGFLYLPNPVLIALPLWVWFRRNRGLALVGVPGILYLLLVLAYSPYTNLRYLVPAIVPLSVVAIHCMGRVLQSYQARRVAVVAIMIPLLVSLTNWLIAQPHLGYLAGRVSQDEYLARGAYGNIMSVVRAHVGPQDRILLLSEGRGFHFPRPVLQDHLRYNWPLLVPAFDELGCELPADFSHVLINWAVFNYTVSRGLNPETLEWHRLSEFTENCLELVHEEPGFALFRRRIGPRGSAR